MGIAAWLGLEDDDVLAGKRKKKKPRPVQDDHGVRAHFAGKQVVRGKTRRRGRRDSDLPEFCADDYTGKVRIKGKTVRYIDGMRQ